MYKKGVILLFLNILFLNHAFCDDKIKINISFQQPSYILEKENFSDTINCDKTKGECKINFDYRTSFSWSFKEKDFECTSDFWFITQEENKCNPNVISFPVWEHNIKVKIVNKKDPNNFEEKTFKLINSDVVIKKPTKQSSWNKTTTKTKAEPKIQQSNLITLDSKEFIEEENNNIELNTNLKAVDFVDTKKDFWKYIILSIILFSLAIAFFIGRKYNLL